MKPIISSNIRVRHPNYFVIGEYSIIDDYCYFSTKVQVGKCSHIASGCSVAGGSGYQFTLGDYSSLSSGVKIWCTSSDFANDVVTIMPPGVDLVGLAEITGDVTLRNYTAVGANSVVMPKNDIPEGAVIGALSFVPPGFQWKPWSVYAGVPIRYVRPRNRERVLAQVHAIEAELQKRHVEHES